MPDGDRKRGKVSQTQSGYPLQTMNDRKIEKWHCLNFKSFRRGGLVFVVDGSLKPPILQQDPCLCVDISGIVMNGQFNCSRKLNPGNLNPEGRQKILKWHNIIRWFWIRKKLRHTSRVSLCQKSPPSVHSIETHSFPSGEQCSGCSTSWIK